MELETQTTLARNLGFFGSDRFETLQHSIESVFAPLTGLIKSTRAAARES